MDDRLQGGTDRDKKLEIHVGRNSRMKSILGSKDYHELHNHAYVGISGFLSQERPDHDLRERTLQFCCELRVVVKYVES